MVFSKLERAFVLLNVSDEGVYEVGSIVRRGMGPSLEVLLDDHLVELIKVFERLLALADHSGEAVYEATDEVGEIVLEVETSLGDHGLIKYVVEILLVRELFRAVDVAQCHRADDAVHDPKYLILQVHWFPNGAD